MGRSIQDQGFRIVLKNIQAPVWHWNRCWLRLRGPIYCLPKTIEGYQSCDSVPWKKYQPNLVLLNVLTNCERRNEMCWLFHNALQTPETEVRVRSRQLSQWCWAAAGSMSISNRKTTPWGQKQIKNTNFLSESLVFCEQLAQITSESIRLLFFKERIVHGCSLKWGILS